MNNFKNLYNFAHRILTSPDKSQLGSLSMHSGLLDDEAHDVLRRSILKATMPGESCDSEWAVVRVFMRNLVNRAFPKMKDADVVQLLSEVEVVSELTDQRINLLSDRLFAISPVLFESLDALLKKSPESGGGYLSWLRKREFFYKNLPLNQLDVEQVIADVRVLSSDPVTRIPNMGVALAANLLADLGAPMFSKPDKHVLCAISALMGVDNINPEDCIRKVVTIAQSESDRLRNDLEFGWLTSGLYPRHLDRLIYMIGSDNFLLNGRQKKHYAPHRRKLMFDVLGKNDSRRSVDLDAIVVDSGSRKISPEKNQVAAKNKKIIDSEVEFYESIENSEAAQVLIGEVVELASCQSGEVYYTFGSHGADVRIRVSVIGKKLHFRTVVVMKWQPRKKGFACQLLTQPHVCHELGLVAAEQQPSSGGSPLPTRVYLNPSDVLQVQAFGLVVERLISDFRGK